LAQAFTRARVDNAVDGHRAVGLGNGAVSSSRNVELGAHDVHQLGLLENVVAGLKREVVAGRRPSLNCAGGERRAVGRLQVELLEKACEGLRKGVAHSNLASEQKTEVTIEYLALAHLLGVLPEENGLSHLMADCRDLCTWQDVATSSNAVGPQVGLQEVVGPHLGVAAVFCGVPAVCVEHFVRYHTNVGFTSVLLLFDLLESSLEDEGDAISCGRGLPGAEVVLMTAEWWAVERVRSRVLIRASAYDEGAKEPPVWDWQQERHLAEGLDTGDASARRMLAAEAAVREAQALGLEWLVVLDAREVLYCPGGDARTFFSEVPWWAQCVHFHNFEVVPETVEPLANGGSWFSECNLFKVNRHFYAEEEGSTPFREWMMDPLCADPWGAKCAFGADAVRHISLERALIPLVPGRARAAQELGLREEHLRSVRPLAEEEPAEPSLFPEVVSLFFNIHDQGRSACRLDFVSPPMADGSSRFRGDGCDVEYVTAGGPQSPVVLSYAGVGFKAWCRELVADLETFSREPSEYDLPPPRTRVAAQALLRRGESGAVSEAFYQRWVMGTPEELSYLQACGLVRRIEGVQRVLGGRHGAQAPAQAAPLPRSTPPAETWLGPPPLWHQRLPGPHRCLVQRAVLHAGPSRDEEVLSDLSPGEEVVTARGYVADADGSAWTELADRPGWLLDDALTSHRTHPAVHSKSTVALFPAVEPEFFVAVD